MQRGFICPDGQITTHEACLAQRGCRMGRRCDVLPVLKEIAKHRTWKGKASVTQCLNGTREEYLKIVTDYYILPDDSTFRLHGTLTHGRLEHIAKDMNVLAEEVFDEDVTGIPDLLMQDEYADNGGYILVDYKTWGSYRVMRALGIYAEDVKTGEVFKSGPRKGLDKTRKEYKQSADKVDLTDVTLQLNRYRQFYERIGFKPINALHIKVAVRDGGTYSARGRGITQKSYYPIVVPFLQDEQVDLYFGQKNAALQLAVEHHAMPGVCSESERWGDKKCLGYCNVNFACSHYQEIKPKDGEPTTEEGV